MSHAKHITANLGRYAWIRELIEHKELIYFFAWRDFKVRYKQTAIGIAWVIIQPLLLTAIVSIFIIRGLKVDFGYAQAGVIIPIFIGMALWTYFERTVGTVSNSLLSNQGILTKIYFPKLIPPIASVLSAGIDVVFSVAVLFVLLLITLTPVAISGIFTLVLALGIMVTATLGIGLFFAALNIKYRDIAQLVPFLFRVGIFATPVFYPLTLLPASLRDWAFLNPMTGAIELARNGFFDPARIDWAGTAVSIIAAIVVLLIGTVMFRRREYDLVDII